MSGGRLRLGLLILLALLYPIAWTAPLLRAGLLPLFGLSEISVLSGLNALWQTDVALAVLVAVFALIAPYLKLAALIVMEMRSAPRWLPAASTWLGRLAMADIFLIAVYIAAIKGVGVGRVETGWGLYLFSFCVLTSLGLGWRRP